MMPALLLGFLLTIGIAIYWSRDNSKVLALIWLAMLCIIAFLFSQDLDLLGSVTLALYSSVFLFLTVFGLSLTTYEAISNPSKENLQTLAQVIFVIIIVFLYFFDAKVGKNINYALIIAKDMFLVLNAVVDSAPVLLHNLFYRIYVGETLFFNLYIIVGLILAILVIAFLQKVKKAFNKPAEIVKTPVTKVKTVKGFRRQTRRKNNTLNRNKF